MAKQVQVGIGVLIIRDDRILLGHRIGKDTGGIYEPDSWCLPGGKQEFGETIFDGAIREVYEETGIQIADLELLGAQDNIQEDRHFVTMQVIAHQAIGEAVVKEPDKQDAWKWFSFDHLPTPLYSPSETLLAHYKAKQIK